MYFYFFIFRRTTLPPTPTSESSSESRPNESIRPSESESVLDDQQRAALNASLDEWLEKVLPPESMLEWRTCREKLAAERREIDDAQREIDARLEKIVLNI